MLGIWTLRGSSSTAGSGWVALMRRVLPLSDHRGSPAVTLCRFAAATGGASHALAR